MCSVDQVLRCRVETIQSFASSENYVIRATSYSRVTARNRVSISLRNFDIKSFSILQIPGEIIDSRMINFIQPIVFKNSFLLFF